MFRTILSILLQISLLWHGSYGCGQVLSCHSEEHSQISCNSNKIEDSFCYVRAIQSQHASCSCHKKQNYQSKTAKTFVKRTAISHLLSSASACQPESIACADFANSSKWNSCDCLEKVCALSEPSPNDCDFEDFPLVTFCLEKIPFVGKFSFERTLFAHPTDLQRNGRHNCLQVLRL